MFYWLGLSSQFEIKMNDKIFDRLSKKAKIKWTAIEKKNRKSAYCRGYGIMHKINEDAPINNYGIRECRIGAMMYEMGWKNALKTASKRQRKRLLNKIEKLNNKCRNEILKLSCF